MPEENKPLTEDDLVRASEEYGQVFLNGKGIRWLKTDLTVNGVNTVVRDPITSPYPSMEYFAPDSKADRVARVRQQEKNVEANMEWIDSHDGNKPVNIDAPGVPCYIVGAGPSLEKNYQALRGIKRGIVIALNAGIRFCDYPDYWVSVDYEGRDWWLQERDVSKTTAILAILCARRIKKEKFKDVIWYIPTDNMAMLKAPKKKYPNMPCLDSGTNCTYTATQIATMMGCDPIVYVGQDYALTNNQEHAGNPEQRHANLKYVCDIYGQPTVTSDVLLRCWKANIAQLFFLSQNRTVINATEAGILQDYPFRWIIENNKDNFVTLANGAIANLALYGAKYVPQIHQMKLADVVEANNNNALKVKHIPMKGKFDNEIRIVAKQMAGAK